VMNNGNGAAHEWQVANGMSMEGLDLVDLDVVATEGGYVSESGDSPLSGELSEDDQ
jgi:hypothetical protein